MLPTNSFITICHQKKYGEEMAIMKITGVLADMLVKLDSNKYRNHVVFENKRK